MFVVRKFDEDEDEGNDVDDALVVVILEGWVERKNPGHKVIMLNNPISPKQ